MTRPSAMPSTTSAPVHVPSAVNWYREHGRVHAAPSKEMAMYEMVQRMGRTTWPRDARPSSLPTTVTASKL